MGIPLHIKSGYYNSSTGKYETGEFDVILVSDTEIEFPNYDIETSLSLAELGFKVDDPELPFYKRYITEGLHSVLDERAQDIFDALEQYGYDIFNHGNFSPKEFANYLMSSIRQGRGNANKKVEILSNLVNDKYPFEYITSKTFSKFILYAISKNKGRIDEYFEIARQYIDMSDENDGLIDRDKYVEAITYAIKDEAAGSARNIDEILDELTDFIDEDDVSLTEDGPYEETESSIRNVSRSTRLIRIAGHDIISWEVCLENTIYDPITFASSVEDLCDASESFCTPEGAERILSYFELSEGEAEGPDEPDHPVSDKDGDYAVLYEQYKTKWVQGKGSVRFGEPIERIIVPYEDANTAQEAIELSEDVFKSSGNRGEWEMKILQRISDKKMQEIEFLRRQVPILPEFEYDGDELLDEWEEIHEGDDDDDDDSDDE